MNRRQRIAVENCMEELTDALIADVFLDHLVRQKIFNRMEMQIVRNQNVADEMAIMVAFNKLKHKSGGWECLITFLRANRYGQLVSKLISFASEDISDDSENDDSTKAECGSIASLEINNSESTVDSSKFPYVVEWLDGCDLIDSDLPTSNDVIAASERTFLSNDNTSEVEPVNQQPSYTAPLQVDLDEKQSESASNVAELEVTSDLGTRKLGYKISVSNFKEQSNFPAPSSESTVIDKSNSSEGSKSADTECSVDADGNQLLVSSLFDRFAECSPSELIPDLIKLMISQVENVPVLIDCCNRLIDQFSVLQLRECGPTRRRRLIEVVLSVLKLHCHDNVIVEKCCNLLCSRIQVRREEIETHIGSIDCFVDIVGDEANLTTTTRNVAALLLDAIVRTADGSQEASICDIMFVKKICDSIRRQLDEPEYDEYLLRVWSCVGASCRKSVSNMKTFLDAGGMRLFQQSYEKFYNERQFVYTMAIFMTDLSGEVSVRQRIMADGNLKLLWEGWGETQDSYFSHIFINFLSESPASWPLGYPTSQDVEKKLGRKT